MTKQDLSEELRNEPFVPFRIHLVSGKTVDVMGAGTAHTLTNTLLVLRNPRLGSSDADGYDVIAYQNIERIEQLQIGKRPSGKRRPA